MNHSFYTGDNVEVLKQHVEDESVDLTVTSPPYDDLRTYNGFEWDIDGVIEQLWRVTKRGGVVVWVVGDKTHNGSETGTSFRTALKFMEYGWRLHDTMIYAKKTVYAHDPRNKRYKQAFEYMFIFSKGSPKTYNEIKDRPNKNAGKVLSGTKGRDKEGRKRKIKPIVIGDFQARYNIWEYATGKSSTTDDVAFLHPAVFPEQLAADHIISWSNENDTVLDLFGGSGTVTKMAELNNRNSIYIDISEEYTELAKERLSMYEEV